MDGTNSATDGLTGAIGKPPGVGLGVAALCLIALLGSLLVLWASRVTWQRVENLEKEFSSLKADDFYLGVRMRGDIQRLNETLVRFRLRGDTNDAEAFRVQAQDFKLWLDQNGTNAATPLEREFFHRVNDAFDTYLTASSSVLSESLHGFWGGTGAKFKSSYEEIQAESRQLQDLCDSFIDHQRTSFDGLLKISQGTLSQFLELLQFCLLLLVTLAAALMIMMYRGMIAPLRHQLSQTQAEMVRHEKLASLGVLAAGVAHEIRNPLTAIKFRLFSLKKTLPPEMAQNEDAAVIASEITRLERIVHDFLQFARPSDPDLVEVPVVRMLREVASLLSPQLEKNAISLKVECPDNAWVRADTQQLKQVLINLIHNAADSIERSGTIALRVRTNSSFTRKGASAVVVEVADTGKGIPPEVQKRLFDPFFTTKEGGTGLGLPIAARIVEKHGGELRYQTELRRGTTFSIVLPRVLKDESEHTPD
jgi:signal transduction histidine kinase